jgi:hypothetical protein
MRPLTLALVASSLAWLGLDTTPALGQKSARAVPAVDKDQPVKFETATFALG